MQIGMIGLGRMGANMVRRLIRGGHHAVVHDRNAESVAKLVDDGASGVATLDELVAQPDKPRAVWVMVPAGPPTEETVAALGQRLDASDVVIDGGNSYFSGAGHFVKMVHNGIEYGLMQAYAEGFDILRHAASTELPEEYRYELDLADVAELWRRGSVVGSWLLDLTATGGSTAPGVHRLRSGFRRGTLDDHGGARRGGPRRRALCVAL